MLGFQTCLWEWIWKINDTYIYPLVNKDLISIYNSLNLIWYYEALSRWKKIALKDPSFEKEISYQKWKKPVRSFCGGQLFFSVCIDISVKVRLKNAIIKDKKVPPLNDGSIVFVFYTICILKVIKEFCYVRSRWGCWKSVLSRTRNLFLSYQLNFLPFLGHHIV